MDRYIASERHRPRRSGDPMTALLKLPRLIALVMLLSAAQITTAEQSPVIEDMNQLTEAALKLAVETTTHAGTFYPFAMVRMQNGGHALLAYRGDPKDAPPPEKWSEALVIKLREMVKKDPTIITTVVSKMHMTRDNEGNKLPSIWSSVDHRFGKPMLVLLPFVEDEDGKHQMGDLVYHASEVEIFK